jgi:predicted aspartyl protease
VDIYRLPDGIVRILSLVALVALPMCLSAKAAAQPQLAGYVAVPVRYVPLNKMIIPVRINGHPTNLTVDTGANHMAINADAATTLGITPSHRGPRYVGTQYIGYELINGRACPVAFMKNMTVGSMSLGSSNVTLLVPQVRASVGGATPVDGVLGADLLVRYRAVINCRTKFIFFKATGAAAAPIASIASAEKFRRVPMRREQNGRLSVPFSIGGKSGRLFVDTGAFVTTFNADLLKILGVALQPAHVSARFSDGVSRQYEMGQVNDLAIGDFKVPPARFGAAALPSFAKDQGGKPIDGILGMDFLYDHNAIIDFGSMSLFLK